MIEFLLSYFVGSLLLVFVIATFAQNFLLYRAVETQTDKLEKAILSMKQERDEAASKLYAHTIRHLNIQDEKIAEICKALYSMSELLLKLSNSQEKRNGVAQPTRYRE